MHNTSKDAAPIKDASFRG